MVGRSDEHPLSLFDWSICRNSKAASSTLSLSEADKQALKGVHMPPPSQAATSAPAPASVTPDAPEGWTAIISPYNGACETIEVLASKQGLPGVHTPEQFQRGMEAKGWHVDASKGDLEGHGVDMMLRSGSSIYGVVFYDRPADCRNSEQAVAGFRALTGLAGEMAARHRQQ
jgi:hypothetical protein